MRAVRQEDFAEQQISQRVWANLSAVDRGIMTLLASKGRATRRELEEYTGKSSSMISKRLKDLIAQDLVVRDGARNDPTQSYIPAVPVRCLNSRIRNSAMKFSKKRSQQKIPSPWN